VSGPSSLMPLLLAHSIHSADGFATYVPAHWPRFLSARRISLAAAASNCTDTGSRCKGMRVV